MGLLALSAGLGLVCLGLLIVAFPRVFAYVVAIALIAFGLVVSGLAIRILWAGRWACGREDAAQGGRYKVKVRVMD